MRKSLTATIPTVACHRFGADGTKEKRYYADGLSPILVKRWDGSLNSGAGGWKTLRTAMILPGVIGHVAAEREATAWNGSGAVTAFTDRHYHYDTLSNTVLETGANAAVLARTDRSAYGGMVRESNASGSWAAGNGATNRPRQTTKETDPDTGQRWFGARWYDTGLGGWISPEPKGLDGPNWYWGTGSAPSTYFDPNGLNKVRDIATSYKDEWETKDLGGLMPDCTDRCNDYCCGKGYSGGTGTVRKRWINAYKSVTLPVPKPSGGVPKVITLPSRKNLTGKANIFCECRCKKPAYLADIINWRGQPKPPDTYFTDDGNEGSAPTGGYVFDKVPDWAQPLLGGD